MLPSDVIYSERIQDFLIRVRGLRPDCSYVIHCKKGNVPLRYNGRELILKPQQMLMVVPGTEVELANIPKDCECSMIAVLSDTRRNIYGICIREDSNWWEKSKYIRDHPVLELTHYQEQLCRTFAGFFTSFMTQSDSENDNKVVQNILTACIITLLDWLGKHMQHDHTTTSQGRQDVVFKNFLTLVQQDKGRKRQVQWYASKLAVSPKYLSTVCHTKSGKSASDIANESTTYEIKRLLTRTHMSSKEIAELLEFDNHSFFCRYVKRELGMSVKEYRHKYHKH